MSFTTEQLLNIRTVISHAGCPDGIASARLVKHERPDVEVRFVVHNSEEHRALRPEPGMLFVDFTPFADQSDEPSAEEVAERVKPFVEAGALVLDHHKHGRLVVEAFGDNGVFADESSGSAGASLAFKEVFFPLWEQRALTRMIWHDSQAIAREEMTEQLEAAREFARLVSIRDTWQRQSPDWVLASTISAALRAFPEAYWMARRGPLKLTDTEMLVGHARFQDEADNLIHQEKEISLFKISRVSRPTHLEQIVKVAFINSRRAEDLADYLREKGAANILVGYQFRGASDISLSLRSDEYMDVGELAKSLGGGGHTRAAGCTLSIHSPLLKGEPPYVAYIEGEYEDPAWRLLGDAIIKAIKWP